MEAEHIGVTRRSGAPQLDVVPAKIRTPSVRAGVIARAGLINGLRRDAPRLVSVMAPAGYGKTTLLAQWAGAETRPVAWVSLDTRDNDPVRLLKYVLAALDGIEPVDPEIVRAAVEERPVTWPQLRAQVRSALAGIGRPFLFVLDDIDLLHAHPARVLVELLVAGGPAGGTLALASRTERKLTPSSLARGSHRVVRQDELALAKHDALRLLAAGAGSDFDQELSEVAATCEGWPAALYLCSLALRELAPQGSRAAGAGDRYVADYIRAECLSELTPAQRRFLRRTSILDRLSGPLCNAVLQAGDSGGALRSLARSGLVVVPDEARPGSYHVPRIVREVLERELVAEEPDLVRVLHRRAADWYSSRDDLEGVLEHARRGGDPECVAATIVATAVPLSGHGRSGALERTLAAFDRAWSLERYPAVALHGSRIYALSGRTADAERWLELAERGARRGGRLATALRPRLSVVRASLCRDGPEQMLADANAAAAKLGRSSHWYPSAVQLAGTAALLLRANDVAQRLLEQAAAAARASSLPQTAMIALSQLSLLARDQGDADRADELADQALELAASLGEDPTSAVALAAAAQAALRRGRWGEARELVTKAQPLLTSLTDALPWLAVTVRIALTRCLVTLRDGGAARSLAAETARLLQARRELGALVEDARVVAREAATLEEQHEGRASLTSAEHRLLPLLATHLSFREIADELHVSRNTVKTQAISIYRKLGVRGRSDAVAAAGEAGGA